MSSCDMASPSKIASILGTLLLGISLSEASQINVTVGQSVLLHCVVAPPPPPQRTRVYWQTDVVNGKVQVVHFVNMGKEELHYQALPYKHRTALDLHQLLAGNYSLLLKNVTKEDNQTTIICLCSTDGGVPLKVSRTTLMVLDTPNKPVSENNSDKPEESDPESFPVWATVLILVLLLLVACVTGVICKVFRGKKAELSSDTGSEASGGVDHVPVEMAEENEKSALNGAQKGMNEWSDTV